MQWLDVFSGISSLFFKTCIAIFNLNVLAVIFSSTKTVFIILLELYHNHAAIQCTFHCLPHLIFFYLPLVANESRVLHIYRK